VFANGLERRVQIVTAALSRQVGYGPFNYYAMQAGTSASQYGRSVVDGETFEPKFIEIKHACSIDALCRDGLIRPPDLVKIDVDGLELDVLDGMRGVMASPAAPRSIQVELSPLDAARVVQLMASCGYVLTERQWTESGIQHITNGQAPESLPHNAVFVRQGAGDGAADEAGEPAGAPRG
jgi:FkbM family methyltransferase